jgi:hypothetical protein
MEYRGRRLPMMIFVVAPRARIRLISQLDPRLSDQHE